MNKSQPTNITLTAGIPTRLTFDPSIYGDMIKLYSPPSNTNNIDIALEVDANTVPPSIDSTTATFLRTLKPGEVFNYPFDSAVENAEWNGEQVQLRPLCANAQTSNAHLIVTPVNFM